MKHFAEMGSGAMMYITGSIMIGSGTQRLVVGEDSQPV
jgi:hypothetical protein